MAETLRLALFAMLMAGGLIFEISAVFGANRFRFSLNRMHPAGMGDTLGLLLMSLAMIVYTGFDWIALKILAAVAVYWITSPVCTHLVGKLVRETEEEQLKTEAKEWKS